MSNKPLFIFDLDGTLFNIDHRIHFLSTKDPDKWNKFYDACDKDTVIIPTVKLFNMLTVAGLADVMFFTGRSESCRIKTKESLWTHIQGVRNIVQGGVILDEILMMRPIRDHSKDTELKKNMYQTLTRDDQERVCGVFEDRQSVVDMWRSIGLTCYQVAPGEF